MDNKKRFHFKDIHTHFFQQNLRSNYSECFSINPTDTKHIVADRNRGGPSGAGAEVCLMEMCLK